jgi:hypothetical protein
MPCAPLAVQLRRVVDTLGAVGTAPTTRQHICALALCAAASQGACATVVGIAGYENGEGADAGTSEGGLDGAVDTGAAETLGSDATNVDSSREDTAESGPADATSNDTSPLDTATNDGAPIDTGTGTSTDAADSALVDTGTDAPLDAPVAYRHSITIDGTNDFTASNEKFSTTSAGFDAYVSWDANALYIGYVGADIGASATANKWLFAYLDVDPTAGTGATKTQVFTTQQQSLPTGFGADACFAWKTDGSYSELKKYAGSTWSTVASSGITFNRNAGASYVEIRIPFTTLGPAAPARLGVATILLSEASGAEWTYAGLWSGSFTDGYSSASAPKAIGSYLLADFASSLPPNTIMNKRP